MKINSNIPILLVLTVFVASNAFLYKYLNNGYFLDKEPDTKVVEMDNVIFKLIAAHELVLLERNAAILAEAERLRNLRATVTDSAELKAIEDKLKALEDESRAVLEKVKNSENERKVAEKQAENDQMQMTELLESNSRMGAQLDTINEQFDSYVSTIEETLVSNSSSETDINLISAAFEINRGLSYLTDIVGNVQQNKTIMTQEFETQLKNFSDAYLQGLETIAEELNDNDYKGLVDDNELLITDESVDKLKATITRYKLSRDRELQNREYELSRDLDLQLDELARTDQIQLEKAIAELKESYRQIIEKAELAAADDKKLELEALEKKLREELVAKESIIKVDLPAPDKPTFTNWVHIPGLWTSSSTELSYHGKRVDSIAWSRVDIEDDYSISFSGQFKTGGECLIILYGNGKFKSWENGLIISISSLGPGRVMVSITRNGIDDNAQKLYSNSMPADSGINGNYYLQISEGKLTIYLNGAELITEFPVDVTLDGRIGFGNRERTSNEFSISNIKLFKIQ